MSLKIQQKVDKKEKAVCEEAGTGETQPTRSLKGGMNWLQNQPCPPSLPSPTVLDAQFQGLCYSSHGKLIYKSKTSEHGFCSTKISLKRINYKG